RCRRLLGSGIDRLSPRVRPEAAPLGAQRWRALTFVHWEVSVDALRPLVPEPLAIDTFDGKAYVGLVPFTMTGVRPLRYLPALPGLSAFHETNVRTYVHLGGRDPGVWFFSLDAANTPAVWAARRFYHLPYWRSDMGLRRDGSEVAYRSTRRRSEAEVD